MVPAIWPLLWNIHRGLLLRLLLKGRAEHRQEEHGGRARHVCLREVGAIILQRQSNSQEPRQEYEGKEPSGKSDFPNGVPHVHQGCTSLVTLRNFPSLYLQRQERVGGAH